MLMRYIRSLESPEEDTEEKSGTRGIRFLHQRLSTLSYRYIPVMELDMNVISKARTGIYQGYADRMSRYAWYVDTSGSQDILCYHS